MRAQEITLSNGLRVIHLENPNAVDFHLNVRINVGLINDPVGKSGLAHVLEHCIFMETEELRDFRIQKILDSIGGSPNAYTSIDHTQFTFSAHKGDDHFAILADIARQVLTEPYYDPEKLANELEVIQNEYNERTDNPYLEGIMALLDSVVENDSGKNRVIGNPDDFNSINTNDLYDYIKNHYHVGNMIIYTGGALSLEEVHETLEATLSAVPAGKTPNKPHRELHLTKDIRLSSNDKLQNYYNLLFKDTPPQDLRELFLKKMASNTISTTLLWELRNKAGCCYGVGFGHLTGDTESCLNNLSISVKPDKTAQFCNRFISYVAGIDDMDEQDILAEYNKAAFFYRNWKSWNSNSMDELVEQDIKLKMPFSIDLIIDTLEQISVQDIKHEMKRQLSDLQIISVKGPQPNLFPPLAQVQADLRNATGLVNKQSPTQPTALGLRQR